MIHATKKHLQKGFTLVEVIVVAVIVAALAGVAVPVYLGYVSSSRTNAATNAAGAVASFLGSCRNSAGTCTFGPGSTDAVAGTVLTCAGVPGAPTAPTITVPAGISIQHHATLNQVTGRFGTEAVSTAFSY